SSSPPVIRRARLCRGAVGLPRLLGVRGHAVMRSPSCSTAVECDTLGHMKRVNVRELHERTGSIVDLAAGGHGVIVVTRGRPVAELRPIGAGEYRRTLPDRSELLARYPKLRGDSGRILEQD